MSSSDETTTGRYYPCGGADGCGHPVNDHARDGCALCPCEYAPEDWLRACEATNARLRERVAALEGQAEQSDWRVLKLTDALADAVLLIHETRHDGAPDGCAERICEIGKQLVQAARDSVVDNLAAALAQADDGGRA